jgi:predicted NAD/FAD-binding protein
MNRIAIIGGGGAGLLSAWLLQNTHSVVLFEEEPFVGGHAHSVPVQTERGVVWVDTGFRYFFPHTYPIFTASLNALQVPICTRPAGMSFSDGRGENTLTAPPTNARSLLSLASSPKHLLWSASFYWFLRAGLPLVAAQDWRPSLREYLITSRIPASVQQNYLLPALASFWGAPVEAMPDFPAYDVLRVMQQRKFGTPYFSFVEGGAPPTPGFCASDPPGCG